MKRRNSLLCVLLAGMTATALLGCGSKTKPAGTEEVTQTAGGTQSQEEVAVSGEITVLTNRTDIVDTVFADYAKQFNEIYPDIKVKFEAVPDYDAQVKMRMNTKEYGDVFLIPKDIPVNQLSEFLEPLGALEELDAKYNLAHEKAYDGQVYGIPIFGTATGIAYNRTLFEQAGIEKLPVTPEEFLDAMHLVKEKTGAIPLYTNYTRGWALNAWEDNIIAVAGDGNYSIRLLGSATGAEQDRGQRKYRLYAIPDQCRWQTVCYR